MRLHTLTIQAFGPYADQVTINFEELNQAGLFLITGPTGAGKTSILDAICFALYGDVPGDRALAKRLRSDHAQPGMAPEVTLEVTLRSRRIRIVRSPGWERAKRRGSGTTTVRASVSVTEFVAGEPRLLSSRLDEAGDLINSLVGMTKSQFCSVALLPQGQFTTFLRADYPERHRLLQQLFGTAIFERLEKHLTQTRRSQGEQLATAEQNFAHVLERIAETAQCSLLTRSVQATDWVAWSVDLINSARAQLAFAESLAEQLNTAYTQAQDRRDHLLKQQQLALRRQQVATDYQTWERNSAARADLATRIERAQAAAPMTPVLTEVTAVGARCKAMSREFQNALKTAGLRSAPTPEELGELISTLETESAALTQQLALAANLAQQVQQFEDQSQRAQRCRSRLAQLRAEVGAKSALLSEVQTKLLVAQHGALHHQRADLCHAQNRLRQERQEVTLVLVEREAALAQAQAERLQAVASELAADLVVGQDCPVCGSVEHPRLALGQASHTTPDEAHARHALDDIKTTLTAIDQELTLLAKSVALLDGQIAELPPMPPRVAAGLPTGETAAPEVMVELTTTVQQLTDKLGELGQEELMISGQLLELDKALQTFPAEISGAKVSEFSETEQQRRAALSAATDRLRHLRALSNQLTALTEAEASHHQLHDAFTQMLHASPFQIPAEVTAAALPAAQLAVLMVEFNTAEAVGERLRTELADLPDVAAPTEAELHTLAIEIEELHRQLSAQTQAIAICADRVHRLGRLNQSLLAGWQGLQPQLEAYELTASLAALVEGKSPDNKERLRLSAYVLGYRLAQVVAAANTRLNRLTQGRYVLEHLTTSLHRESRGGLSLGIFDSWTDQTRSPHTLSGGESFVLSLALALGLADVVSAETVAGTLDTLFIDEGFGALDAETLEEVLATLDSLREGGRVVGVVSHVPEMVARIPHRLQVVKQSDGSSIHQAHTSNASGGGHEHTKFRSP